MGGGVGVHGCEHWHVTHADSDVQNERRSLCSLRSDPQLIGELAGAADAVIAYCTTIRCAAEENRDTNLLVRGRCGHTHLLTLLGTPAASLMLSPRGGVWVPPRRCALQIRRRICSSLRRRAADGAQPACGRRLSYNAPHRMRATAACRATCNGRARCTDVLAMERARVRIGEHSRACWPELRASTACACALWSARADPLRSVGRAAQIRAATAA